MMSFIYMERTFGFDESSVYVSSFKSTIFFIFKKRFGKKVIKT